MLFSLYTLADFCMWYITKNPQNIPDFLISWGLSEDFCTMYPQLSSHIREDMQIAGSDNYHTYVRPQTVATIVQLLQLF